jgi:putative Mg2+ transporter-C (MgtC) family protein
MNLLSLDYLSTYWSSALIATNILILFNLLGALLLGLLIGYERSYHGRAAGMRTYGLVCLASAALTVIVGYPELWYGGHGQVPSNPDVTRVIQGIVTGIGFLGAGVIIKEGFTISGLTTAASIWVASAVGILVGVGFYMAAILLSVMSSLVMMWVTKLEKWLPSRHAIAVTLTFNPGFAPSEEQLDRAMMKFGFEIAKKTLVISSNNDQQEWHFSAVALLHNTDYSIPAVSAQLSGMDGIASFHLALARN